MCRVLFSDVKVELEQIHHQILEHEFKHRPQQKHFFVSDLPCIKLVELALVEAESEQVQIVDDVLDTKGLESFDFDHFADVTVDYLSILAAPKRSGNQLGDDFSDEGENARVGHEHPI